MTEQEATALARGMWPEAEGFQRAAGGWTFRIGGGYASVSSRGRVATQPQGTRRQAERFMNAY